MKINWNKILRTSKSSLLIGGSMSVLVSIGVLYLVIEESDVKSKNDLYFLSDQIDSYNFYKGYRGFRDYTIKLKNYNHAFRILADFVPLFRKNDFENYAYGDSITIGLPKRYYRAGEKYVIFSIASKKKIYLDYAETINKYNTTFKIFIIIFFFFAGIAMLYFGYKFKPAK